MKYRKILQVFKEIAEEEFRVKIKNRSRKRIYINARAAYFRNCRVHKGQPRITTQQAAEFIGYDHATAVTSFKNYNTYRGYDGFEEQHARVNIRCEKKKYSVVTDPIEWRDRYIARLKKLYRKRQSTAEILRIFVESVEECKEEGTLSRENITEKIQSKL